MSSDFKTIYERILKETRCATQAEIADHLGISQSSISDAKKRNSIPDNWLIQLFDKDRLNPDYVRFGTGKKRVKKKRMSEI